LGIDLPLWEDWNLGFGPFWALKFQKGIVWQVRVTLRTGVLCKKKEEELIW